MTDEEKTTASGARLAVIEAKLARYHQRAAEGRIEAYRAVAYGVIEDEREGSAPDPAAVAALEAGRQPYRRAILREMLAYADESCRVASDQLRDACVAADEDDPEQQRMLRENILAVTQVLHDLFDSLP